MRKLWRVQEKLTGILVICEMIDEERRPVMDSNVFLDYYEVKSLRLHGILKETLISYIQRLDEQVNLQIPAYSRYYDYRSNN